jgi:hypothetical protein
MKFALSINVFDLVIFCSQRYIQVYVRRLIFLTNNLFNHILMALVFQFPGMDFFLYSKEGL